MKHFNIILGILSFILWVTLYLVYYKDKVIPWFINRFTRDRMPKKMEVENGYYPDGSPIPFRENLYPSGPATGAADGTTPPNDTPEAAKAAEDHPGAATQAKDSPDKGSPHPAADHETNSHQPR